MRQHAKAPSHAEQVRTVSLRATEVVLAVEGAEPLVSPAHLLRAEPGAVADVLVLAPQDHPVTELARTRPGSAAVLEVTDSVAVALREPVRALAWLRGELHPVDAPAARSLALLLAAAHPREALLDVGHGATILRLVVSSAVLADATGAAAVPLADLAAAAPDPFALAEDDWLSHLDAAHGDLLAQLARHLPPRLHRGTLRPLGLDRHGIRLRVEREGGDVDVRLPFPSPVTDAAGLTAALRALVGCPFRRGLAARPAPHQQA